MDQTDSNSTIYSPACPGYKLLRAGWRHIYRVCIILWEWSVPHRNSHRPDDELYAAVWSINVNQESTSLMLHTIFPGLTREELPKDDEDIRLFLHEHFPPPLQDVHDASDLQHRSGAATDAATEAEQQRQEDSQGVCEETWEHLPTQVRYALAAANAHHLERKLQLILQEDYHCSSGLANLARSSAAIGKTFRLWRLGFRAAVSTSERVAVKIYFVLLVFMACYPDVVAGFLGERSYNQRSIGSRIFTLIQLFFLWTFPYHSIWLLFNWSLERLLGALVGNLIYALVALIPAVGESYRQAWLRAVVLVLSTCWQLGVQFGPTLRDYLIRLLIRRQMLVMRTQTKTDQVTDWKSFDEKIRWELTSHKDFAGQKSSRRARQLAWQNVPIRVRIERYIQFTSTFMLGRSNDQLIGLLKDDMENLINTLEDYKLTSHNAGDSGRKGHIEPRVPKFLLVFLDVAIFTYVCYSFRTQPFTFNTVVAYSSVVIIKQTILAIKRYQTIKGARRLFTNMVSVNVLGVLLVSTPVTVDPDVLADTRRFVALTAAMVFATLFLAEPIAPILLRLMENTVARLSQMRESILHLCQTC